MAANGSMMSEWKYASRCARSAGGSTPRASPPPTTATSAIASARTASSARRRCVSKGFMKPDDLCIVDMDGKQVSGKRKRSSEILLHLAIMKARPDVRSCVHCHPPHATAFAVAHEPIPKCILPEVEVFLGEVPIATYETPGTPGVRRHGAAVREGHRRRSSWPTTARSPTAPTSRTPT